MPTEVHYESDSGDLNDSRLRVDLLDGGRGRNKRSRSTSKRARKIAKQNSGEM